MKKLLVLLAACLLHTVIIAQDKKDSTRIHSGVVGDRNTSSYRNVEKIRQLLIKNDTSTKKPQLQAAPVHVGLPKKRN